MPLVLNALLLTCICVLVAGTICVQVVMVAFALVDGNVHLLRHFDQIWTFLTLSAKVS